jgi:thioredoxin reductase
VTERSRGKAPKAVRTSDVARPRTLAISAIGAAAGVSLGVFAESVPLASSRPIARPHAKLACASCHAPASSSSAAAAAAAATPAAACKTCHGSTHVSARPAHRALAAKGELSCPSCHTQHAGSQGVTFESATVVRWGAGSEVALPPSSLSGVAPGAVARGTTVPLVSLAACARCHDPARASDPIAACVPADARARARERDAGAGVEVLRQVPSQCFDEHAKLGDARPAAGAPCAAQHGPTRFVAWDVAREIAATTPWVAPAKPQGVPWPPAAGALAGALVFGAAARAAQRRGQRPDASTKTAAKTLGVRKRLPTINPQTCLGCYACVDACPFDVLTIDRYVAVVARPEECCGVVLCEQVCPNGSLRVAEGEPILDRPGTTEHLESRDVPGVYLAGDLTGLPLIKNAINQGARVVDHIASTLPRRRAEAIDVIVVGAGPAGLSAALRAKERDLSCVVVEQATVAASIKSFPRDKLVHDPPLDLPVEGELWLKQATKEELVTQWTRIVRARGLDVREGCRVVDVARGADHFVVRLERGDGTTAELRAARVVMAIGRRGTPRRLDLEIEPGAEERVSYALADARSFEGKRVVVVGLGDTAMEAALAIARQPGASVTMSYRGARFSRGKAKNVRELESAMRERKVKVLFETVPVALTKTGLTLSRTGPHGGRLSVGADAVLVLIGGVPAWDLLMRVGIRRPADPSAIPDVQPSR